MKIQPLHDLQQEINRLFIAGAKFAKDDPRLLRVATALDPLGEKAPVFKRLAAEVRGLAVADGEGAADRLGALGAMLYSVLYTQGDALEDGRERHPQTPILDLADVSTLRSHAELAQVRELAMAKSGRLELAREAFSQGMFADFRCFPALDAMLGERYADLAEFVSETVIPAAGRGMAPFAFRNFRYEDTVEQARRFRVLARFDAPQLPEVIDRIFGETLPGLQAEAIAVLARSEDNEEMIVRLVGDKNKKVREAACMGLAALGTPRALETLLDLFLNGKAEAKRTMAARALAEVRVPAGGEAIGDALAERVEQAFEALAGQPVPGGNVEDAVKKVLQRLLGGGKAKASSLPDNTKAASDRAEAAKLAEEAAAGFLTAVQTLRGKKSDRAYALLERMVADERLAALSKFYGRTGNALEHVFAHDIPLALSAVVDGLEWPGVLEFYERWLPKLPDGVMTRLWRAYFLQAVSVWQPKRVYDRFAPVLDKGLLRAGDLFDAYRDIVEFSRSGLVWDAGRVDPRWLSHLYRLVKAADADEADAMSALRLLHACEPTGSGRLDDFLASFRPRDGRQDLVLLRLSMLAERRHPRRFELMYDVVAKYADKTFLYQLLGMKSFWQECPKEYAKKYKALQGSGSHPWLAWIVKMIEES